MKEKKRTSALVAKRVGGIVFLFVFMLNIVLFIQKDDSSNGLTLDALKAYALTGGEGELPRNQKIVPTGCYVDDELVGYANDCELGDSVCTDHECN